MNTTHAIPPLPEIVMPTATWTDDFNVLWAMLFSNVRGDTQQERLESFYITQADLYDGYRHRMLWGRLPMIKSLPIQAQQGVFVDMGGGTAFNLEMLGEERIQQYDNIVVLDLCPSLVKTAQRRIDSHSTTTSSTTAANDNRSGNNRPWNTFIQVTLGDACDSTAPNLPAAGTVDLITFSYSLTMIPDWRKAIRNAYKLLKVGGHIAVCDFTIDPKEQLWGMGALWTWFFAQDNVHLREEHITALQSTFETIQDSNGKHYGLQRGFGTFPYLPWFIQAPWYSFVGVKKQEKCPDLLG